MEHPRRNRSGAGLPPSRPTSQAPPRQPLAPPPPPPQSQSPSIAPAAAGKTENAPQLPPQPDKVISCCC